MTKQAHLTLEECKIIEVGLNNGPTRKSIADTLGKDKSTICKEVKRHTVKKTYKFSFGRTKGTYDCIHISQCGFNHYCPKACEEKKAPISCKRRDRRLVCVMAANSKERVNSTSVFIQPNKPTLNINTHCQTAD